MTDLITWLRAQLDTDERIALSATPGPWRVDNESFAESIYAADDTAVVAGGRWNGEASVFDTTQDALHIAAHDPARALRQVQAHRAILDAIGRWRHYACQDGYYSCSQATEANGYDVDEQCADEDRVGEPCDCGLEARRMKILGPLASIYSDRDGYDPDWSA